MALDGPTVNALRWQRERQDEIKRIMRDSYEDRGVIFAGACGEYLKPAMLSRTVKALGERVGEPGMTVRQLTHFHAWVTRQSRQSGMADDGAGSP